MPASSDSLFKIDKFRVPHASRAVFLELVGATHRQLGTLEGCLQNHVLEQVSGPGHFNFVTVVEWKDAAIFQAARLKMQDAQKASGFDRATFIRDNGIEVDMAEYASLPL